MLQPTAAAGLPVFYQVPFFGTLAGTLVCSYRELMKDYGLPGTDSSSIVSTTPE